MDEAPHMVGGYVDQLDDSCITVMSDAFAKQLSQCAANIVTFDAKYKREMGEMVDLANEIILLLTFVHKRFDRLDATRQILFGILANGFNTFNGGLLLLRAGLPLQESVLYRNLLEAVCSAVFLFFHQDRRDEFLTGKLPSHVTVSTAKAIFPTLGRLYGELSNDYAHIGKYHHEHVAIRDFTMCDVGGTVILFYAKPMLWLLYVVCELCFYDVSQRRWYWRQVEPGAYEFDPYPGTRQEWHRRYFGEAPSDAKTESVG
jgi:hypothetical protein